LKIGGVFEDKTRRLEDEATEPEGRRGPEDTEENTRHEDTTGLNGLVAAAAEEAEETEAVDKVPVTRKSARNRATTESGEEGTTRAMYQRITVISRMDTRQKLFSTK
jgi:hypothetical protein